MKHTAQRARPLAVLVVAISLLGGVAEAQTQVRPGWNLFSAQQDAQIGYQSAVQAERQLPRGRAAVGAAGARGRGPGRGAPAGGPRFQYRFRVVNDPQINAFALPGGYIYLNRGIIENARNEGEVASVLAHEIAHVALRHGTHQASKAQAASAGVQILGGILGGRVGNNTAQVLNVAGGVGLNALFLKFTRQLETQADVRGAQILAASGYSVRDMVGFFHQLERVDRSRKTTWLSHHPAPPDRIARIEQERRMLRESSSPRRNTTQLARVQQDLRGYGRIRSSARF